jgi:uncharacterized protein RhaS with RHS repeats
LTRVDRPDGKAIVVEYDTANRVDFITLPRGVVDFDYNLITGNLELLTAPDGGELGFGYNADLLTSSTWSGEVTGSVSRTYDTERRVKTRSVNGGQTVTFQFDDDGLLKGAGALVLTPDPQHGLVVKADGLCPHFTELECPLFTDKMSAMA